MMGPDLPPPPVLASSCSWLLSLPSLSPTLCGVPPPVIWLSGLPQDGLSRVHPLSPFPTTPHLPSFPTLIFLVTVCSMTMCPQPVRSEGAGPKSGLFTVLVQRLQDGAPGLYSGTLDIPPRAGTLVYTWAGRSLAPWAPPPAIHTSGKRHTAGNTHQVTSCSV